MEDSAAPHTPHALSALLLFSTLKRPLFCTTHLSNMSRRLKTPCSLPALQLGSPDPFPLPKEMLETQDINIGTWNLSTKIRQRSDPAEFCPGLSATGVSTLLGHARHGNKYCYVQVLMAQMGGSWKLSNVTQVKEGGGRTFIDVSAIKIFKQYLTLV